MRDRSRPSRPPAGAEALTPNTVQTGGHLGFSYDDGRALQDGNVELGHTCRNDEAMVLALPLTSKQMDMIVSDYQSAMPGWSRFNREVIYRDAFPVRQTIWFEPLRSGNYRPMHGVETRPLREARPPPRMLPQMLTVRQRQLSLRQHETRQGEILQAMKDQFRPAIDEPLEIPEVLALCEAESRGVFNDLAMLAILYAWLGRRGEARSCCLRLLGPAPPVIAPVPERDEAIRAFASALIKAIEAGNEKRFLQEPANGAAE